MSQHTQRHTNRLLGYPNDARLLIINADDFGALAHGRGGQVHTSSIESSGDA